MIGEYIDIKSGMLLIVDSGFTVNLNNSNGAFSQKVKIKKGEIIEIRFPFKWNFRTSTCNTYCNCKPELLIKNCSFFGIVHDETKSMNNKKTKEIVDMGLYHKPNEFKMVRK